MDSRREYSSGWTYTTKRLGARVEYLSGSRLSRMFSMTASMRSAAARREAAGCPLWSVTFRIIRRADVPRSRRFCALSRRARRFRPVNLIEQQVARAGLVGRRVGVDVDVHHLGLVPLADRRPFRQFPAV